MKKLLLFLLLSFSAFAENAKLVYITQEADFGELSYIGEIVRVNYNVLILDGASVKSISFLPSDRGTIKNPNVSWNELPDGSLSATFYVKIEKNNFTLPILEVVVEHDEIIETERSQSVRRSALSLDSNHELYCGVIAQNLSVQNYDVKFYDNNHNIIVMDLRAEYGNLEDFKISGAIKQGFESKKFAVMESSGIYYAVVPNSASSIDFEYFDKNTQSYKIERIKNVINKETININQDINPINNVLIFKNIVLVAIIVVLLGLFWVRRIPLKVRISGLVIAVILLVYLVVGTNSTQKGTITKDSYITILPTKHSTIIDFVITRTNVEIIGEHEDYYKISTGDGKTGWVKKDHVK